MSIPFDIGITDARAFWSKRAWRVQYVRSTVQAPPAAAEVFDPVTVPTGMVNAMAFWSTSRRVRYYMGASMLPVADAAPPAFTPTQVRPIIVYQWAAPRQTWRHKIFRNNLPGPPVPESPLPPLALPSRPKSISWLLDIGGLHLGTRDCELDGVVYRRAIVTRPSVDRRLDDELYGFQDISRVSVEIATRTEYEGLWNTEYRGVSATLRRYDWRSNVSMVDFDGAVERVTLSPGRIRLDLVDLDLSVFESELPRKLITPEVYGYSESGTWKGCPDAGKVEQKIFGNVTRVPLPYVHDHVSGGQFWYLLSVGTGYTVTKVERDLPSEGQYKTLQAGEYQVRTDLVTGRTLIRTFVRQLNGSGGGFHRLYADVTGPPAERNFARAVRWCFEDPTWGLGETIDSANWATAEADLPAGLYCDGVLNTQRAARDWIDKLLVVRGMRPTRGPLGWRLAVDKAPAASALHLADGPGPGARTMLKAGVRTRQAPRDQVSVYRLKGYLDLVTSEYRMQSADRDVGPLNADGKRVGTERAEENPFLRDATALDMTACYRAKRLASITDRIEGAEATEDGRALVEGDVISVTSPLLHVSGLQYQVVQVRKDAGRHGFGTLVRWTADRYIYSALPLAIEPDIDQDTTPPGASSFTFIASGAELGGDGTAVGWVTLRIVIPATPAIDSAVIDRRRTGTASYGSAQEVFGEGSQDVRFNGLTPGLSYDFRARTKSGSTFSTTILTVAPIVIPGDTTAPSAPTVVTPRQSGAARLVEIQVTGVTPPDWGTTILLRNTVNTPGSAVEVTRGKQTRFTDRNVSYGTTYFYWARYGDNTFEASGIMGITGATTHPNLSPMSPSSGAVAVAQTTGGDIGSGQVGTGNIGTGQVQTPNIGTDAVTTAKRQDVIFQSAAYTLAGNAAGNFTVFHGLGRIPVLSFSSGNILVTAWPAVVDSTQITIRLLNISASPSTGTSTMSYW